MAISREAARLNLLPKPRTLEPANGRLTLSGDKRIALLGAPAGDLLFTAHRLQAALRAHADVDWQLAGSANEDAIGVVYALDARCGSDLPATRAPDEAYELLITPEGIIIRAPGPRGAWNATLTLIQIIEQAGATLPCLRIADAPDFPHRGVMLDVTRCKVPTLDTLCALIDRLAGWKINQVQLYTEHAFAYRNHRVVWEDASPLTAQDILELDAYCRARFVELVPNQNSLGHLERWLRHPPYRDLAETLEPFKVPWGMHAAPFSLDPRDPRGLALMRELFDELLPNFSSRQVNVGLDETFDIGHGKSRDAVAEQGGGRVYLTYLKAIHALISGRGHTMQFWGDMILNHPELVPELPRDAIALSWGYTAEHPFDAEGRAFAASGIPFYVCPGTSSWQSLVGRADNAIANIRNAAEAGLRHGAIGLLNTDWGDFGHHQYLPASYPGFAYGAAVSWALAANRDLAVAPALDTHAFRDSAGAMGAAVLTMANAYKHFTSPQQTNSNLFGRALLSTLETLRGWTGPTPAQLRAALKDLERGLAASHKARMALPDAALVQREFENAARMARHGAARIAFAREKDPARARALKPALRQELRVILREHEALWLARNAPGGLPESLERLSRLMADYR